MQLLINVHQMELTTRLQNYVEKKTSRLDRYMPYLAEIRVDLSTQSTRSANDRQVAQITIEDERGTMLRAEERSNDMFAAIDAVVDKLYRQIERYRGKRKRKYRGSGATIDNYAFEEPLPLTDTAVDDESQTIVRRKIFSLHPMSPEEAIDQMHLH